MKRTWVLGAGTVGLAAVLVAAAFVVTPPAPARATPYVPPDGEVIATVDPREPAPSDVAAAVRAARRHIERARRDGDPRYLGRAQAALAPWWQDPAPPDDVLLLRATIRQALHDFTAARADLDELIRRRPADTQARLTRAVVATITGDTATAAADCEAIAPRAGELIAAACAAPVIDGGYDRLVAAIAAHPATPDLVAWAEATAGDVARTRGDDRAAEAHYRAALAAHPADVYARRALATLLLDHARGGDALAVGRIGDAARAWFGGHP